MSETEELIEKARYIAREIRKGKTSREIIGLSETRELIEKAVTPAALAAHITAEFGEFFGVYADGTFAVGESIGNEITPGERPVACVKCPGIGNVDTTYFTEDFVTYNPVSGLYESIEQDRTGIVDTYTLPELIRECCKNGDVDEEIEELRSALITAAEASGDDST